MEENRLKIMNYIQMSGGLGNQLFEYAFGLLFKEVKYDVSWFIQNSKTKQDTVRKFGLTSFDIPLNDKLVCVRSCKNVVREIDSNYYQKDLLDLDNTFILGYFQCYQYCIPNIDYLRKHCVLLNPPSDSKYNTLLNKIKETESVSIHVRRGDYLNHTNLYRICGTEYYKKAYEYLESKVKNATYFIFSEDKNWCQNQLGFIKNSYIVDTSEYSRDDLDIMLMKECKHNIIPNSTYSWWSAFLNSNPNKIVISPHSWFVDNRNMNNMILPDWISL